MHTQSRLAEAVKIVKARCTAHVIVANIAVEMLTIIERGALIQFLRREASLLIELTGVGSAKRDTRQAQNQQTEQEAQQVAMRRT